MDATSSSAQKRARRRAVGDSLAIQGSNLVCWMQLEAERLRETGIYGLLEDPKMYGTLNDDGKRLLVRELDRLNNSGLERVDSGPDAEYNKKLVESAERVGFWSKYDVQTGTTPWNVQSEDALNIFCDVAPRLRCEKDPAVRFDAGSVLLRKDPTTDYQGGYANEYKQTENEAPRAIVKQVVWMWKPAGYHAAVGKLLHPSRPNFVQDTVAAIKHEFFPEAGDSTIKLAAVQLLIPWHPDAIFKYHQDPIGDWAVIINLSPGSSALHVAGSNRLAEFSKPGDAHIISTSLVHRSFSAQLRTMKLVIFLKDETKKLNEVDGAEKRSGEETSEEGKKNDVEPQGSDEVTALDGGTPGGSAAGASAASGVVTGKKDGSAPSSVSKPQAEKRVQPERKRKDDKSKEVNK